MFHVLIYASLMYKYISFFRIKFEVEMKLIIDCFSCQAIALFKIFNCNPFAYISSVVIGKIDLNYNGLSK